MDHVERPRRSRRNMGGAARALTLGLAIGSWPLNTHNGVVGASDLPNAAAATSPGVEGCGFRVSLWGEVAAGGRVGEAAGYDELSVSGRPDRVQAMVGGVPREAGIMYGTEAGSRAWTEVLDFGCVDGRDMLAVTLFDKLLRPLAICEVEGAGSLQSGQALVCEGAHGVQFEYAVEHANLAPYLMQPERALQVTSPSPAPETEAPDTPSPVDVVPDPTELPTAAEAPETASPTPETDAPTPPATPAPFSTASPAPITPATPAPVTPDTPAPVTPATPAPVTPATPAPVTPVTPRTPAPTPRPTPEPTAEETTEPTPRPVAVTPGPTARTTTEPPVPATTPAPVTPPVAATPEPTVGTPPATDSPVSPPTSPTPPTLEPTTVQAVTPAPTTRIGTDTPTGQAPVAAPIASTTTAPASPTATPVDSPPITVTSPPSAAESPTSPPGTSTPAAEDDDSDAPTTEPVAPPTATPSTAQPVSLAPVGSSPIGVTSSPSTIPPTATAPVLPPTTESPTSPTDVATPGPTTVDALVPTPTPDPEATDTPATATTPLPTSAPPAAGTIPPVDSSATPSPTPSSGATLSPNTAEVCTDACIENETSNDWTHTYYDPECEGMDGTELSGCNFSDGVVEGLENCRTCILNIDEYEADTGENTLGLPLCPCCVASSLELPPQTEKCSAEVAETPSPTFPGISIDLSTEANDPDLLMIRFNSESCTASGIAVISATKVIQVTGYSSEDLSCGKSFDILYGTECESDETTYDWDYTTTSFGYEYSCSEEAARLRRRLADEEFLFEAEGSDTLLCNNGLTFVSLSNLQGDEEGLVYAKPAANNFDVISDSQNSITGTTYCGDSKDLNTVASSVLESGVENVLEEPDDTSDGSEGIAYEIVIPAVCALLLLMGCGCFCCYRHRKGKEGRADHMRRNLGYSPDVEATGKGSFGPTNQHVAITSGGARVTPEMLATKTYNTQPTYPPTHHRAPSEAPSSVIEDNIANNYRPKKAAKSWMKRKEHKELTKPAAQQHVVGAAATSEEHTAENTRSHSASARSEQLSELSLNKLELANQTSAAPPNYSYNFEEVEEDDEDDDARSAATGMSGPSKYAPSGYAPSSHHGGVTHDLMSQYEPSVYEADSQYDPSLYGRESEYGDESSSYSYNDGAGSSRRGGYSQGGGGRGGRGHISGRASVADTAAMSHLGSVREMDDGGSSAYAASESYVSSYVSSEDDDGRPARSIHPRAGHDPHQGGGSPEEGGGSNGGYSRHSSHRSGRQQGGGRSGFSASSAGGSSSRHSGARSGFEEDGDVEYDDEEDESAMGRTPVSMEDIEYYSEEQASSRGGPLTNLEETHEGQRW